MDTLVLVSQEGKEYQVEKGVAQLNQTIKNLTEDVSSSTPIPLVDIPGKVLEKIIEHSKYHYEHPKPKEKVEDVSKIEFCEWDLEFIKLENELLFGIVLAANYLENQDLLDLACSTLANMIKGKPVEEIRKTFNIKNDFTPEEEAELEKENDFCE